ncbi:MAG: hypothetical protein PUB46_01215 [Lachnospiraceae bacterium]|uniref:hypothetical protein n=1 Tax=Roseburia hominis TaxID=301301 RepID=UPI001F3F4988|nr:hypothetical protein [Roseburia hominis]MDD6168684.1 hypothetical protein [Lachnospiraceae bacterium]MDY4838161.1 hypothetical protein [Lachnospiraceae bacterium]
MQSKISFFNKTIFKKNITHYWPLWLGYLIISLFEIPFAIYLSGRGMEYYGYTGETLKAEQTYQYVNQMKTLIEPGVLFLAALLAAMIMLSYLYNSRSANMFHSLPLRREELFFTNYLSGLSFLLIPKLIATFLGVFVCAAVGITELQYLLIAFLYIAGMLTFFYSFAFVVGMLVGQLWAFPVCYLVLNFIEVIMEAVVRLLATSICFGMGYNWKLSKLSVLSPVVYLTNNATIEIDYLAEGTYQYSVSGAKSVLIYFLLSIPMVILALFIYKKKKMETVGDLVTIKTLKPVFRWIITICGALGGAVIFGQCFYDTASPTAEFIIVLIMTMVNAVVFFFVAQMFLEKKFKVFTKKRFLEVAAGAAVLAVALFALEFDVFGIEKKVPNPKDVEWVGLENSNSVLTEEDEIAIVTEIQSQIISEKKELENEMQKSRDSFYNFMICYKLKDGSRLERAYNIPINNERFKDETTELAQLVDLLAKPENYMRTLFGNNYKTTELRSGYLETYAVDEQGNVVENDLSFDAKNAERIYDAIRKDMEEGSFKKSIAANMCYSSELDKEIFANCISLDFYNEKGIVYPYSMMDDYNNGVMARGYYNNNQQLDSAYITINEDCKHTIEALKQIGAIQDEEDLVTYAKLNEHYQQMGIE